MVPHMPEEESDYDPTMLLPPTPISDDDDSFKDEDEPMEEEGKHAEEFGGVRTNSSPHPDSSSHQDSEEI